MALNTSGVKPLEETKSILSELNNGVTNIVLSNPKIPILRRLEFFNFVGANAAEKPDLRAHVTLAGALFSARMFNQVNSVLNNVAIDEGLRSPPSEIVELIVEDGKEDPDLAGNLCDTIFWVYANNGMFEEALSVFDETEKRNIPVNERCCVELLNAMKKLKVHDSCSLFFDRMVKRGIEITVYSLSIAVDSMCR